MNRKVYLFTAATVITTSAQATCYTIYKPDGTMLQETATSPVNLTHQIGDTVPMKFGPGAILVISEGGYCRDGSVNVGTPASLAEAVRAEEQKAKVLKVSAAPAEEEPGAVQMVKETAVARETEVVQQREGNVLTIKGEVAAAGRSGRREATQ